MFEVFVASDIFTMDWKQDGKCRSFGLEQRTPIDDNLIIRLKGVESIGSCRNLQE